MTYGRVIVNYIPEKQNPNRTSPTVGRDRVNYHGDCETPTVDLLTFKILLNSIISTPGANFITIDTKKIYLKKPLERSKYMRVKLSDLPADFVKKYNVQAKVTKDGYVLIKIRKRMCVLLHADILAQELLEKHLNAKGYRQSTLTPGF